jgi:CDP-glucose 4,6-dehydratase
MMLLAGLISNSRAQFAQAWNLGPQDPRQYSVRQVLELMAQHWQSPDLLYMSNPLPEAGALALDSSLASNNLGWISPWDTERVVAQTAAWYRDYYKSPSSARDLTLNHIEAWRQGLLK